MIRAVLFDWGNTLAAWELDPDLLVAGHQAGLEAIGDGVPAQPAFTEAFVDRVLPRLLAQREDEIDYAAAVADLFRELGADIDGDGLSRFVAAEHHVWRPAHRLDASALALLDALRARGLRLGIVSNVFDSPDLVRELCATLGVLQRVDTLQLSGEVGKRKPHGAIFQRALDALGVAAADVVMVGDKLREDVGGAQALGMRAIQAVWFADDDSGAAVPDARALAPADVLGILDGWSVADAVAAS